MHSLRMLPDSVLSDACGTAPAHVAVIIVPKHVDNGRMPFV